MLDVIVQVLIIGMPWEEFALLFIAALAGGAFGAALGALPAFIFTGFVVFLGEGFGFRRFAIVGRTTLGAGSSAVKRRYISNGSVDRASFYGEGGKTDNEWSLIRYEPR